MNRKPKIRLEVDNICVREEFLKRPPIVITLEIESKPVKIEADTVVRYRL